MSIEIETYAQLEFFDENIWYIGEPFEKRQIFTILDLEENTTDLEDLKSQLKENLSKFHNKRVKVLVTGKIEDNCNGSTLETTICCFGNSMTIHAQKVVQLTLVEDYIRPE